MNGNPSLATVAGLHRQDVQALDLVIGDWDTANGHAIAVDEYIATGVRGALFNPV
jgi:hypothetical protein